MGLTLKQVKILTINDLKDFNRDYIKSNPSVKELTFEEFVNSELSQLFDEGHQVENVNYFMVDNFAVTQRVSIYYQYNFPVKRKTYDTSPR